MRSPASHPTTSIWRYVAPVALVVLAVLFYRIIWDGLQEARSDEPVVAIVADADATTLQMAETIPANVPRRYRIRKNDTLSGIADRYGITVDYILELNPGLDPMTLAPGTRIILRAE